MEAYEFIEGHERLIAHFGLWPSFHDSEVHRLVLDRTQKNESGKTTPTLDLLLRGWVMTAEISESGAYKLHGDAVVHLQFADISDLQLEGFNNQNVLSSLNLEVIDDPSLPSNRALRLELEHCYEFDATFVARSAKIISITPYA
jgi:hypothetical protein